ncbi:hypothetical protein [Planctomyces sp. SH-PL62]|uniref:hypothetical protein n=1 Tax=Planctomyces sp. SH-PL62 TaxID=1636152 RepID=UPI00078D4DC3|nr:hypothetical protein [Planctomyces sp. SH-PL62]AMV39792.1 hypothetical protein VT85_20330 [Planctomyces sp. SH-PL62]
MSTAHPTPANEIDEEKTPKEANPRGGWIYQKDFENKKLRPMGSSGRGANEPNFEPNRRDAGSRGFR